MSYTDENYGNGKDHCELVKAELATFETVLADILTALRTKAIPVLDASIPESKPEHLYADLLSDIESVIRDAFYDYTSKREDELEAEGIRFPREKKLFGDLMMEANHG